MIFRQAMLAAASVLAISGAALAQDAKSAVATAREAKTTWPGPTEAVKAEGSKNIYVITCASQGIGCVRAANGVVEAGAVLGWDVRVIDGRGDPAAWNAGILSAVTAKADGIVLAAVPPMLVGDALAQAKAAGISVVSVFNPKPEQADSVFAYVRPDHVAQGALAADWVEADSGGTAKIILVEDPIFPELVQRGAGFRESIASCGGCEIVEAVESTLATMAQRLPGAVAAALSRRPDANYVIAPFDSNGFFANEGVRQAGRIGAVRVGSYEGDPQTIAAIRNGEYAMTIADPAEWMGWQAADELVRAFAGAAPANVTVVDRLVDKDNAPTTEGWLGDLDYKAEFRKLWGK
ncbi:sugar ABC transporter substrate-binding protein [Mesorhizobium australicum]|uniref:Monosaccharide ABC transporter substrate-binding protein, CUT2 family n=1 Tax=Mesorhizobium australicum TaxID=536018 RepID=A0A1X7N742_9HYPH|nr:substrate-binding domain-containing protein [Mesorhizobium australicum]SMH32769.1 monosaccharide ABC transporter substrate-binding protein, CUT2 family [Mesorhizobium australicum]